MQYRNLTSLWRYKIQNIGLTHFGLANNQWAAWRRDGAVSGGMHSTAIVAIMALQAVFLVATADAHPGRNYNINGMNFDMWCQEQAHLPADRCDKRLPGDEQTFEDFRDKVDQYEVPYLQQKQRDMAIHRDIMQNDPIDNPASQDPQALVQDPNRPPRNPFP